MPISHVSSLWEIITSKTFHTYPMYLNLRLTTAPTSNVHVRTRNIMSKWKDLMMEN